MNQIDTQGILDSSTLTIEEKKALKAAELLQHFALDPRQGTTLAECFDERGPIYAQRGNEQGPTIVFALSLYRMVNPFGCIELPRTSQVLGVLVKAIQDNLSSKEFKAACVHLRMQKNLVKRQARLRVKAEDAYSNAYHLAASTAPAWKAFGNEARLDYFERHVYPAARAARDAVYAPAWERMSQRMKAVEDLACNPEKFANLYFAQRELALHRLTDDSAVLAC